MGNRIEKGDAQRALGGLIRAQVKAAAGDNDLVSKTEAKELDGFVGAAEAEVRAGKAPYARVRVNEVVDAAMSRAMEVWARFNPPDRALDAKYLSRAELKQISGVDADLGALSTRAYQSLASVSAADRKDQALQKAVDAFLGQPRVGELLSSASSFGRAVDARPGSHFRREVPDGVLRGFDIYLGADRDTSLKEIRLGGQRLWALHMQNADGEGFVELSDRKGEPLVSARLEQGSVTRRDAFFGLGRYAGEHGRLSLPTEEGFSEDPDRRAHGQITSDWRPEAEVRAGRIFHDGRGPTGFETKGDFTPEQAALARFAVELMYPRSLKHRAFGEGPIDLGRNATIALGRHTDPRDGQSYLVADYRDHDDDGHTFYFQPARYGNLDLARIQYNN